MTNEKYLARTLLCISMALSPIAANAQLFDLLNKLGEAASKFEKAISQNSEKEEIDKIDPNSSLDAGILKDAELLKVFNIKGHLIGAAYLDQYSLNREIEANISIEAKAICSQISANINACTNELLKNRDWIDSPTVTKSIATRINKLGKYKRCNFESFSLPLYTCKEDTSLLEHTSFVETTYLNHKAIYIEFFYPNIELSKSVLEKFYELIQLRAGENYLSRWERGNSVEVAIEFPMLTNWKKAIEEQKRNYASCEENTKQAFSLRGKRSPNPTDRAVTELLVNDGRMFKGACGDFNEHAKALIYLVNESEKSCGKCLTVADLMVLQNNLETQDKNSYIQVVGIIMAEGALPKSLITYLMSNEFLNKTNNSKIAMQEMILNVFFIKIKYGNVNLLRESVNELEIRKAKGVELSREWKKQQENLRSQKQLKDF